MGQRRGDCDGVQINVPVSPWPSLGKGLLLPPRKPWGEAVLVSMQSGREAAPISLPGTPGKPAQQVPGEGAGRAPDVPLGLGTFASG